VANKTLLVGSRFFDETLGLPKYDLPLEGADWNLQSQRLEKR